METKSYFVCGKHVNKELYDSVYPVRNKYMLVSKKLFKC